MRIAFINLSVLGLVWAAPNFDHATITSQQGNTLPPIRPKSDTNNSECTTNDGESGECVPHYLCDSNNSIITTGQGIINERTSLRKGVQHTQCQSLEVCCVLRGHRNSTDKKLAQQEGCGRRNPNGAGTRIIDIENSESSMGEFPWMVIVLREESIDSYTNMYLGGGSLIHPSVVMTAAHIVSSNLKVRAGEWDTQSQIELYPFQERDVSSVAIHKDFNKGNYIYDIALLFLETPMEMAPNVGVVCLPPPSESVSGGTKCLVSGWGKDKLGDEGRFHKILRKIQLPIVEREQCQNLLRRTQLGKYFELDKSFMCAGGEAGKDACKGDGGSPLVCPIEFVDDRYVQSGIVAWSIGCGDKDVPGVYVDVSHLRPWIDNEMEIRGYDTKVYNY